MNSGMVWGVSGSRGIEEVGKKDLGVSDDDDDDEYEDVDDDDNDGDGDGDGVLEEDGSAMCIGGGVKAK